MALGSSSSSGGNNFGKWAHFKKTGNVVHQLNEIMTPGLCNNDTKLKVKVTSCEDFERYTEFTFEAGRKKFRGVSFGPARKWNKTVLKPGYVYVIQNVAKEPVFKIQVPNEQYRKPQFTGDYELILPPVKRLNKKGKKFKIPGIPQLIKCINTSGKVKKKTVRLSNVKITDGHLYRYRGCDQCTTKVVQPPESCLICPKCGIEGGDKSETSKLYMIFRNLTIEDSDGNCLNGAALFNHECEKVFRKEAADFLFDEGPMKQFFQQSLIGAVVNVTISLECKSPYRNAGTHENMNIVASNLRILSQETTSGGNGVGTNGTFEAADLNDDVAGDAYPATPTSSAVPMDTDASAEALNIVKEEPHYVEEDNYRSENNENESTESNVNNSSVSPTGTSSFLPSSNNEFDERQLFGTYPSGKVAAVIINIKKFENMSTMMDVSETQEDAAPLEEHVDHTRHGSEKDVARLKALCCGNIDIDLFAEPFLDVNLEDLRQILAEFKEFAIRKKAESCAIFFMSHGSQNLMRLNDGSEINFYLNFLHLFSDDNFPEFKNKPKLFFNQICQMFSDCSSDAEKIEAEKSIQNQGFLAKDYSSIFICVPQLSGNKAVRFPQYGTLFIQNLCSVIEESCGNLELARIIQMVGIKMTEFRKTHPDLATRFVDQAPQWESIRFEKLYFFKRRDDQVSSSDSNDANEMQ